MTEQTTPAAMIRHGLESGATPAEVTDAIRAAFPHLTDDELAEAFDLVAGALATEARDLRQLADQRRRDAADHA